MQKALPLLKRIILPFRGVRVVWFRITHWETWDWRIKYIFITPAWFWYCLRARSLWFFTAANPTLTFGGFEGESKMEMYDQLPPGSYPKSIFVSHTWPFKEVEKLLSIHQFDFPLAVKPNVGKMGLMFRRLNTPSALDAYHGKITVDYILQELILYPLEVSIFYYRFPHEQKGNITGFLKKEFLEVTGNGESTLWTLILQYPRVRYRLKEMKAKHRDKLEYIVPRGEVYYLSYALNLSRGGKLVTLSGEKDSRLLKVFDGLSLYTKHFYYGRYDVKCKSIEDLKEGKNFSILEYNGSGAEPHHVYGNGYTLWQACNILVSHWKILYKISRFNHQNGIPYWDFKRGWEFLKNSAQHVKKLKQLDSETEIC